MTASLIKDGSRNHLTLRQRLNLLGFTDKADNRTGVDSRRAIYKGSLMIGRMTAAEAADFLLAEEHMPTH
jgi:hypothetical protein